jgi:RNA polymerase sigma factor (sigma-70 family)
MDRQESDDALRGIDDVRLAERVKGGDSEAFEELHRRYEKKVYGFIRVRTNNDADAQDLAQETWLKLSQKMPTYDPTRASPCTFAKYWASIMLLRYYDRRGAHRKVEVFLEDLQRRFPDLEHEQELADMVARLAGYATDSVENSAILREQEAEAERKRVEIYEELLHLTFNGSSPPHQLICFGFRSPLEWEPRRIVAKLSTSTLSALAERLETDYLNISHLPEERARPHFARLHATMSVEFSAFARAAKTRDTYQHLLARKVGETTLQEYYTGKRKGYADEVADWCSKVRSRVWSVVAERGEGPLFDLLRGRE